jgi:hypothetical protein
MLAMYYLPGWEKIVSIEEHKTSEEILQTLTGNPMGDFIDFEIYPVVDDFSVAVKVLAKKFNIT